VSASSLQVSKTNRTFLLSCKTSKYQSSVMSHNDPLRFASRTAFQSLTVEEGEETEEEVQVQPQQELLVDSFKQVWI
jgi:hypothetical protein